MVRNARVIKRVTKKNAVIRSTCKFTLPGKDETRHEYLGLLDTGSMHSLLVKSIAYGLEKELKKNNGAWTTNTGDFVTRKLAIAKEIGLPEFSRKRTIAAAELLLNPNNGLKYKAIFGMDFLLAYGIDFINSR